MKKSAKSALGLALGASLLSAVAMADVAQYIAAGYNMDQVIALAQSEGLSTEEAVEEALRAAPAKAAAIVTAALKAGGDVNKIVALAVAANPDAAQAIVTAAISGGGNPQKVAQIALANGASRESVSAATAAGAPAGSSSLAGGGTTVLPPMPPLSVKSGAGPGGGTRSASDN